MTDTSRRNLLTMMGTGALMAATPMPDSIRTLMEVAPRRRTGSIKDVEHIVVITQENRSFDHYFGTLRGVRGYSDPRAVRLPSGRSVFHQPNGSGSDVLPFRPTEHMGSTFLPDPPHGWNDTHAAWNGGRHDGWVPAKGIVAMTHHTRADLPYHFALADAFTVCDAYHCSVMGPTDPNRYHLWTGWVGNDGAAGGPVITNAEVGYDWSTFPERLEKAGVSWKVYQDVGDGLTAAGSWGWTGDAYIGNYGDNALLYFHQYQNAQPGNPLADKAKTGTNITAGGTLFDQFAADVAANRLPQVSYVVAPEAYTEHPNWAPDFGAWYLSKFIDVLAAHPDVFSSTVVLLNYDEEGGFFDHQVPPTPPFGAGGGDSTVALTNEIYPGDASHPSAPYGLGMRVPLIAISPWSRGGWVNSQVFDHTSVIKFIEARFADRPGLREPNITPWRRAVVGDLTSVFDFRGSAPVKVRLPDAGALAPRDHSTHPNEALSVPAVQAVPMQESGTRPARALPYRLEVDAATAAGSLTLTFVNSGTAAAVFHVRSTSGDAPRSYTVEAGKRLQGTWPAGRDLSVHGPNGFFRRFAGSSGGAATGLALTCDCEHEAGEATLNLTHRGSTPLTVSVVDGYSGRTVTTSLAGGKQWHRSWDLEATHGWYDLTVTVAQDSGWVRQVAGHLEDGRPSSSDPALGRH